MMPRLFARPRPRRLIATLAFAGVLWATAPAKPVNAQPQPSEAVTLYQSGKREEALAVAEAELSKNPTDLAALVISTRVAQELGRLEAASRWATQLTRHHPGFTPGWEMATQVYQASGELKLRDEALKQLVATQAASLDRDLRTRRFVLRDRIDAHGHVVVAQDHVDTGGPDAIRYVFIPERELSAPKTFLVVLTDTHTTETWRESGILSRDKRLFHLDSIFTRPDGRQGRGIYATYADLPDYDTIRAKVLEILSGKAKPLSGEVGGLAVPAGPGG